MLIYHLTRQEVTSGCFFVWGDVFVLIKTIGYFSLGFRPSVSVSATTSYFFSNPLIEWFLCINPHMVAPLRTTKIQLKTVNRKLEKNDLRKELWFLVIWFSIMHTWYHGTRNKVNRPNKIHILCC